MCYTCPSSFGSSAAPLPISFISARRSRFGALPCYPTGGSTSCLRLTILLKISCFGASPITKSSRVAGVSSRSSCIWLAPSRVPPRRLITPIFPTAAGGGFIRYSRLPAAGSGGVTSSRESSTGGGSRRALSSSNRSDDSRFLRGPSLDSLRGGVLCLSRSCYISSKKSISAALACFLS